MCNTPYLFFTNSMTTLQTTYWHTALISHFLSYSYLTAIVLHVVVPITVEHVVCDICRYQFFLQLKQDLYDGRLECPFDTLVELAGYALQCKYAMSYPSYCYNQITYFSNLANQIQSSVRKPYPVQ